MYKRTILALLVLAMTTGLYAQENNASETLKGAHPWDLEQNENGIAPKFAHWSLDLDLGFNSFDGDFNSEMKHPVWAPSATFGIEYHFTPVWTISAQYVYDWYRVTGNGGRHADVLLDGMMHRVQGTLGFDLMSACFPRAQKKIFAWELFVGGGNAWYKNGTYYTGDMKGNTAAYKPLSHDSYHTAPYIMAGTSFDFNVNRTIALGIKGTYSYFVRDDVDGRGLELVASKNNDGIFDVSMHIRFKLAAVKKTHVKNISGYKYYDDMTRNNKKDTVVIINKDTVYMMAEATNKVVVEDNYYFVYFENNQNGLDDAALIGVQQIATRMQRDENLNAEIIGHCDNTGAEEHNVNLGVARAQNVRDELVEEYRIDPSRITYSGAGAVVGGRSTGAYSANRRCDIRLMDDAAAFEQIKRVNDEHSAEIAANAAQAMAEREEGVITAPEGLTLSGIARKYYGNTYCWVFIYAANMNTLKTPNYIPSGTRLVIPDLSEEQKNISKRNAQEFYENLSK